MNLPSDGRSLYRGINAFEPLAYIKDILRARGGTNLYGEPNFRVVRACSRWRISGGKWFEWKKDVPQAERIPGGTLPERVWTGYKPVLLYPLEMDKWVVERWMPPEFYGSREMWYQPVELGGTVRYIDDEVILGSGHFPQRGDYESCNYFLPNDAVVESIVGHIVGRMQRNLDVMVTSKRQRVLNEIARGEEDERRQQVEFDKYADEQFGQAQQEWGLDARTAEAQGEVNKIIESVQHTGRADVDYIKKHGTIREG